MLNLFQANLMRLRRSVIYKLCLLFVLGMILYMMLCGRLTSSYSGEKYPLEHNCYNIGPFLSVVIPLFSGLFLGTEYSDGAMRNKLIVGCSRRDVFLSEFLTVALGSLGLVAVWYIGMLAGIPRFGVWQSGVPGMLQSLLISVLFALAIAALFTLLGMLIPGKAVGSVSVIVVGLGMLFAASMIYNLLLEPEMTQQGVIVNGELVMSEPTPNPDYVAEPTLSVMRAAMNSLPSGQAILLANIEYDESEGIADPATMIAASCAEVVLLTAAGVVMFGRKDVR